MSNRGSHQVASINCIYTCSNLTRSLLKALTLNVVCSDCKTANVDLDIINGVVLNLVINGEVDRNIDSVRALAHAIVGNHQIIIV